MTENDHGASVGAFFDSLTSDYTQAIERCFPRYREMLWALIEYLPTAFVPEGILELGAGTGNLTQLLLSKFPREHVQIVDVSGESLDVCVERFSGHDRLETRQADFRELDYSPGSFGLVVSSISIHHLDSGEKQTLFNNAFQWLRPGGVLAFADQFSGESKDVYQKHISRWKLESQKAGSTPAEWEMWMQHQATHDFHDSLPSHLAWLKSAGFSQIDCTWRFLLWATMHSVKVAV